MSNKNMPLYGAINPPVGVAPELGTVSKPDTATRGRLMPLPTRYVFRGPCGQMNYCPTEGIPSVEFAEGAVPLTPQQQSKIQPLQQELIAYYSHGSGSSMHWMPCTLVALYTNLPAFLRQGRLNASRVISIILPAFLNLMVLPVVMWMFLGLVGKWGLPVYVENGTTKGTYYHGKKFIMQVANGQKQYATIQDEDTKEDIVFTFQWAFKNLFCVDQDKTYYANDEGLPAVARNYHGGIGMIVMGIICIILSVFVYKLCWGEHNKLCQLATMLEEFDAENKRLGRRRYLDTNLAEHQLKWLAEVGRITRPDLPPLGVSTDHAKFRDARPTPDTERVRDIEFDHIRPETVPQQGGTAEQQV